MAQGMGWRDQGRIEENLKLSKSSKTPSCARGWIRLSTEG
jgi:hypothetical protein